MYSSDSPLEPEQVRKTESLAETVERELSNERKKIRDRESKIEAAEEYRSHLEEIRDDRHVTRKVVRELDESHVLEDLNREILDGKDLLHYLSKGLREAGYRYGRRDTLEDFHRNNDLEPEECLAIVLETLKKESEDSDLIPRATADGGLPRGTGTVRGGGEGLLEVYDQLDVSKSDFQPYSPRELVSEITEGYSEIKQVLDDNWKDYDSPLERAEKFVESVQEYLETIGYKRDELEGVPYERSEEIVKMTEQ